MKIRFLNASSGDWTAMYVDGRKVAENHSIDPEDALRKAGVAVLPTLTIDIPDNDSEPMPVEIDMETGKAID